MHYNNPNGKYGTCISMSYLKCTNLLGIYPLIIDRICFWMAEIITSHPHKCKKSSSQEISITQHNRYVAEFPQK